MESMKITRHIHRGQKPNEEIEQLLAVIPSSRPVNFCVPGEWAPESEHRVVFNSLSAKTRDGEWIDTIIVNGTIFSDKGRDDTFCSELFHALTGKYPYEVMESTRPVYGDIVWG